MLVIGEGVGCVGVVDSAAPADGASGGGAVFSQGPGADWAGGSCPFTLVGVIPVLSQAGDGGWG